MGGLIMNEEMREEMLKEMIRRERKRLPYTLTPKDIIEILPWGRSKVYEAIRQGVIPARKVKGSLVINRDLFLIWLYSTDENDEFKDDISSLVG